MKACCARRPCCGSRSPRALCRAPSTMPRCPCPQTPGYASRAIQPFAASYQPSYLKMGRPGGLHRKLHHHHRWQALSRCRWPRLIPPPPLLWPPPPWLPPLLRPPAPVAAPTPAPAAAPAPAPAPTAVAAGETPVNSPMPGNIFKVECKPGQAVKAGDVLVVLEAMKMEIEVSAPVDGTVKSVSATVGTAVNTDDLLVVLG